MPTRSSSRLSPPLFLMPPVLKLHARVTHKKSLKMSPEIFALNHIMAHFLLIYLAMRYLIYIICLP